MQIRAHFCEPPVSPLPFHSLRLVSVRQGNIYIFKDLLYSGEMDGLEQQRMQLGMTQSHVAFLLGTRQANISAYEAGSLFAGQTVTDRLDRFLDLKPGTVHTGTWLGTMASHAVNLRALVKTSNAQLDELDLDILRYVVGMNDAFAKTSLISDQLFFLTQPASTGDRRIDALLAGMAVHWSRIAGLNRAPSWTREPQYFLQELWWVGISESLTTLRCRALCEGIPSLRSRGILLDRSNLASV